MFKAHLKYLLIFVLSTFTLLSYSKEYLKPEEAFKIRGQLTQEGLEITFDNSKGYYIYQDSIQVSTKQDGLLTLIKPEQLPVPHEKFDDNFQKTVRTYDGIVSYRYSANSLPKQSPLYLEVQVQGCAEKGICYPPMMRYMQIMQYDSIVQSVASAEQLLTSTNETPTSWWEAKDDLNALNMLLGSTSTPVLLGVFFLLGLGLAFTPCMLPMLPILSSIVFGATSGQQPSRKKSLTLASFYVFGMALAFSLAGMATAWFGAGVSSALQNPIVIIGFGLMMIALSGSLLGMYELRLPHAWNQMVHQWMDKHQGGSLFGVFMLGALSSLIASPCVTAPLAGILTFIAHSGKVELGGLILFVMALGMGLPLLLFAIGARSVVPKAGSWMVRVQRMLAYILIGFALWMMYPAVSNLIIGPRHASTKAIGGLDYQVVTSLDSLKQSIATLTKEQDGVFITYYADWCISCKEIDKMVLSNPDIKNQLQNLKRIEIDVTTSGLNQKELLNEYQLFGPPAFIFINAQGQEVQKLRVVGIISPEKLQEKLRLLRQK
jgi:thiol:disulfide interchange protein DsbD